MPTLAQQLQADQAQYAGRVQTQATTYNTTPVNVTDALTDPAYEPAGSWEVGAWVLAKDLANPLNYASCYETARTLFPILTGPNAVVTAGTNPAANYSTGLALRTELAVLTAAMQQAAATQQDTVFRAEVAGHGTTLVVRADGTVEMIESLANGRPLMASFAFAAMPVATVVQALGQAFDDDINQRAIGANTLHWVAGEIYLGVQTDADPVFPNVKFRWWAAPLEAGWRTRWMAQFTSRLAFLETL